MTRNNTRTEVEIPGVYKIQIVLIDNRGGEVLLLPFLRLTYLPLPTEGHRCQPYNFGFSHKIKIIVPTEYNYLRTTTSRSEPNEQSDTLATIPITLFELHSLIILELIQHSELVNFTICGFSTRARKQYLETYLNLTRVKE